MPEIPFTVERFGGLDLLNDPEEVGATGAVDLLNVDFDRPGRVRARNGYSRVVAVTMATARGLAIYDPALGLKQVVIGYDSGVAEKYAAYTSAGVLVSSTTVGSGYISGAARIGTSSNSYLYLGNYGVDTLWRWSGSAFSQPAGMPKAAYLAVTPTSGRLAGACIDSTLQSRVMFSDPGNAESWPANNYVDLVPGDGLLLGLATWQNLLFAFKNNRFFVFTGESTDSGGNPVFNYRTVDGYGAYDVAAGDEGVYFADGRSVWLTTGDIPIRISAPIEPFLRGAATVDGVTVDQTQIYSSLHLSYSLGRLYVCMATTPGGGTRTMVFDPKVNAWTVYNLPLNYVRALHKPTSELAQSFWLSSAGIETFGGATTDNGSSIQWSYRSGKYAVADPGRVAVIQESSLFGYSTTSFVILDVGSDSLGFPGGGSVVVGSGTTPAEGYLEQDNEGKLFQHNISGTVPATISRLTHYVSFVKPPGVQ